MNHGYPDTWRYDHELTREERRLENKYNEEMLLYMPYDITPGKWHDIYWLLTEWRTSSATIQAASTPSEKQELLKKQYLLSYHLDSYLSKVMRLKS